MLKLVEEYSSNNYFDILDKIKDIPYLTKDMVVSVEQVANYYEVSNDGIKKVIQRNREQFKESGIATLKGGELKDFKDRLSPQIISNKTTVLNILTRKSMLLIAFYLQNNDVANKVKSELFITNPSLYKYYSDITSSVVYIKRYERGFEEILHPLLSKYNKIEKQVPCGSYRIDYVINNFIAIEVDENGHKGYDLKKELIRENYIINNGYKLMRFNPNKQNCLEFIGELIQLIHTNNIEKYNFI